MNNQFDELTKNLAQLVTRRVALKKFGLGLAGITLSCFGLATKATATTYNGYCEVGSYDFFGNWVYNGLCLDLNGCIAASSADCPTGKKVNGHTSVGPGTCGFHYKKQAPCSFTI